MTPYESRGGSNEIADANLSFDQVKALVSTNKRSAAFTDECVIAVCWKESSFNPNPPSPGSSARGLMQMTQGAIQTVNNITPPGIHFESSDMVDPAKAIQCGTYYLQWCSDQSSGDENQALDKYGGVSGYSTNVVQAEACLLSAPADPMSCLTPIHPFEMERLKKGLVDDPTGQSRFVRSPKQ